MKSKFLFFFIFNFLFFIFYFLKAQVINTTTVPFDYGNGFNGVYNPASSTTLAGGVYNYTSVNIPSGVSITVSGNVPLVIKCQGNVNIAGTLNAAGNAGNVGNTTAGGTGGITNNGGGQAGGQGGKPSNTIFFGVGAAGVAGSNYGSSCKGGGLAGVGGGTSADLTQDHQNASGGGGASYGTAGVAGAVGDCIGSWCSGAGGAGGIAGSVYGDSNLVAQCGGTTNILGGSGGGGGGGVEGYKFGGEGGAGGGSGGGGIAIIAKSINITGSINVSGGNGGNGLLCVDANNYCAYSGGGGGGSGGTILLGYHNTCIGCTTTYVNISGGTGGTGGTNTGDCNIGTSGAGGNGGLGRLVVIQDSCTNPVLLDTISNQTICQGDSISFTIHATGNNLTYQWTKNSSNISGATNSVYNTGKITSTDNIIYSCKIINVCGTKTLPSFTLFVNLPPTSNTIFANQFKYPGDSTLFTIFATGTGPFTYQWIVNDTIISGATDSIYKIDSIKCTDAGTYSCRIGNTCDSIIINVAHLYTCPSRFKGTISGYVKYDNSDSTIMTNTYVYLENSFGKIIDSIKTDSTGFYFFNNLWGEYNLICSTTKPWGGVNPVDALITNRTYIKLYTLNDTIKRLAADVNNDSKINPVDALMINRRYIKLLHKFTIPDWLFKSVIVTFYGEGENIKKNILCICAGDVNGSYLPPK